MKLRVERGLLFADAQLVYRGRKLGLTNVLLDTGSAGTLFSVDHLVSLGLQYEPEDRVRRIRGVGGSEFVFTKHVESLALSELSLTDFLVRVGAVIDLQAMELRAA
jgi:hypothetical protein